MLDASRDINNRSTFSGVNMTLYETAKARSNSEQLSEHDGYPKPGEDAEFNDAE